jgi:arylsulfatase
MQKRRSPILARIARRSSSAAAPLALLLLLASCSASEPGPSHRLLLLISVDTLRADHLGAYGSDRELTPRIDALARESQVFAAAYAPTSHTVPSVSAILTGRYPEELGIWSNESPLPEGVPTLAATFRDAGWHTAAVVSNWVLRRASGLSSGFEHYDDALPELEAARPMPERLASDTTTAALDALEACLPDPGARCFLWVHYQDPHGPYTPPGETRARWLARERAAPDGRRQLEPLPGPFGVGGIPSYQFLEGEREVAFYRAGYDAEVAYLDQEIGRLLDALVERELLEQAVFVLTADHGESLGEDDYWFSHGEFLSDPLVRVPLLIRLPGVPPLTREDIASLVDLPPTFTALLLQTPPRPEQAGRPLLEPGAEQRASTPYLATLGGSKVLRLGIVHGEFKYLVTLRDGVWDGRLLRRDREEVDLSAPAPHVAAEMRKRLEGLMRRYQRVSEESRPETPADREKLEALGYAEPEASREE